MRPNGARARGALVVLVVATAVLAGCGGGGDEQDALEAVCDARANIESEISDLRALTPGTATIDGITQSLDAIREDLTTISDAKDQLNADREAEIEAATEQFSGTVGEVVDSVGRSVSADEADATIDAALTELQEGYSAAMAPIDCS